MNLTERVKKWLIENCDVKATATDDEFKEAMGKALVSEKLSMEKLSELTTTKEDKETDEFAKTMSRMNEFMDNHQKSDEKDEDDEEKKVEADAKKKAEADAKKKVETTAKKVKSPSHLEKILVGIGASVTGSEDEDDDGEEKSPLSVRAKQAIDGYSKESSTLKYPDVDKKGDVHAFAGQPVIDFTDTGRGRRYLEEGSEKAEAISGAFAKFMCLAARVKSNSLAFRQLSEHEKEIMYYAMENSIWNGTTETGKDSDKADIKNRRLTPSEQKALIDDATSGGLEAAPIHFDDQVIQTPLLHSELFTKVNRVPIERGRRIEAVEVSHVTGTWGGIDDTAIALFNTTSYVTAFDTTIFRWEGAIQVGLDFMSDTPIDFNQIIRNQYGERLLEDLDDVIATGNGTTQPEGIMNKSGTTSITFGSSTTLGNYESLRFGVAKPEHGAMVKNSAVFCGTETSYQRARAIPVGASDARRIGGMNYDSYEWMQRPYAINESMANTQVFYAILARYRMYVRRGLVLRASTEGDTLIRNHVMLLVAMARYGGQLERGATAAVTTDAPA